MAKQNNNLIIGIIVVVVIIILLGSLSFGGYGMMGRYNTGFALLGGILNILIIILIIIGIFWVIKHVNFKGMKIK